MFSVLWHTCNIYWFNISFVVLLHKSSLVNSRHPLSTFATLLLFSKAGQESVNSCNLSVTLVNYVHDVAKSCKFIGNFRSNQKQPSKC